jgi:hypothetical protein
MEVIRMELDQSHVGSPCTYVDPVGQPRPAIITAVHGSECVNVVFVNDDKAQTDNYGRKTERATSVVSSARQQAHGNYYLLPGETR